MNQPNIIYILTGQQRWDAMGCSGEWVETPQLDRIANEGVCSQVVSPPLLSDETHVTGHRLT